MKEVERSQGLASEAFEQRVRTVLVGEFAPHCLNKIKRMNGRVIGVDTDRFRNGELILFETSDQLNVFATMRTDDEKLVHCWHLNEVDGKNLRTLVVFGTDSEDDTQAEAA